MKKLNYIIEDATITEILGVNNFSNKESAVLELVKNSYDAGSDILKIEIYKNSEGINIFKISDSGIGMTEEDIKTKWMRVGKSEKGYSVIQKDGKTRILAGSKGVGRFAMARLGKRAKIYSQCKGHRGVYWESDWNENKYELRDYAHDQGTTIIIEDLRDVWIESSIKKLTNYLSYAYNSDLMTIEINYNGISYVVKKAFLDPKIGINYTSKISLNYIAEKSTLNVTIDSDEFKEEIQSQVKENLYKYNKSINILSEIFNKYKKTFSLDQFTEITKEIGDFEAELYYSINSTTQDDVERFNYKHGTLKNRLKEGLILYRNAFSIVNYDSSKDWLQINSRARKSPAAATHPTGSWRVRSTQISGKITIDKNKNKLLKELSNRQGLEEDEHFKVFIDIIHEGIETFEYYRQNIIRKTVKNIDDEVNLKTSDIFRKVISDPSEIKKLSDEDAGNFVEEVKKINESRMDLKTKSVEDYLRFKYDVRILNVLATIGLKSSAIAHELINDRDVLSSYDSFIVDALKSFGLWDLLNDDKHTFPLYNSIPHQLETSSEAVNKILIFMDTMLEEIEKDSFQTKNITLYDSIEIIKNKWERDYSWVNVNFVDEMTLFDKLMSKDIMNVIFDNLILNSIQQNAGMSELIIDITYTMVDNLLRFTYKDNGIGLNEKYRDDPMKILQVHETTRADGHGLGMWIFNNTLSITGGKVVEIPYSKGFTITFDIGGEL